MSSTETAHIALLREEFAQELRAWEDYVDRHGNPNDDWREMCRDADKAADISVQYR
jgi:hypothetical protein